MPLAPASQRGEAPASLRSGPPPARDREEIRPHQNLLPAYESSRVQLSMSHALPSFDRYPESEVGINQRLVNHEQQELNEHRRQERGGEPKPLGLSFQLSPMADVNPPRKRSKHRA